MIVMICGPGMSYAILCLMLASGTHSHCSWKRHMGTCMLTGLSGPSLHRLEQEWSAQITELASVVLGAQCELGMGRACPYVLCMHRYVARSFYYGVPVYSSHMM